MTNPPSLPPIDREPFMAFVSDDAALDLLHPVAVDLGWRPDACHKGGLRAAMPTSATSRLML